MSLEDELLGADFVEHGIIRDEENGINDEKNKDNSKPKPLRRHSSAFGHKVRRRTSSSAKLPEVDIEEEMNAETKTRLDVLISRMTSVFEQPSNVDLGQPSCTHAMERKKGAELSQQSCIHVMETKKREEEEKKNIVTIEGPLKWEFNQ